MAEARGTTIIQKMVTKRNIFNSLRTLKHQTLNIQHSTLNIKHTDIPLPSHTSSKGLQPGGQRFAGARLRVGAWISGPARFPLISWGTDRSASSLFRGLCIHDDHIQSSYCNKFICIQMTQINLIFTDVYFKMAMHLRK
jgi:hypothetical protein